MRHLTTRNLGIDSPTGRSLVRGLEMRLEQEHVAVVGRNGVGKSTLLAVLAGLLQPTTGRVECHGRLELVGQAIEPASVLGSERASPGERRRRALAEAFSRRADFLLLDEPSQELDRDGARWLAEEVRRYPEGLLVVTHDRALLRLFDAFFVVAESGCRLVTGGFDALLASLHAEREVANQKYSAELARLSKTEEHNAKIRRRRARKLAGGRVRELDRCPARVNLNNKRGYAQVSYARREGLREERIAAARDWARATRRALSVQLPLDLPPLPLTPQSSEPVVTMRGVHSAHGGSVRFPTSELELTHERMAVIGPNGSGKSTLLQVLMGDLAPDDGFAKAQWSRVGYVAQQAQNWQSEQSLIERLLIHSMPSPAPDPASKRVDQVAELLARHRFPFALAERPLYSLSPGERTRAALIELFHRTPRVELLVLDEPTVALDLLGLSSLEQALAQWQGGLLVVSHDEEFLQYLRIERWIEMAQVVHARRPVRVS